MGKNIFLFFLSEGVNIIQLLLPLIWILSTVQNKNLLAEHLALQFLESSSYGIWLVSIMGLGMICYGLYMFVKAKYGEHKA